MKRLLEHQKNKIKILIENKNFRNNQNYIINYRKIKKKYFSLNLIKEDNNIFIQIFFIILYLFWFFILIFLLGLIANYELFSALLILSYFTILPIYLSIKWYADFIYLFKSSKYLILKKVPYNNYYKYKELNLIWINKNRYINNELIILKK